MGAAFDTLEANQISRGAGLTQSSGREKVTVTKRVSDGTSYQLVHRAFTLKSLQTQAGGFMKVEDEASDSVLFHPGICSRHPTNRVGAPFFFFLFFFFGKSECAAMSRLTGMAEGEKERKMPLSMHSELALGNDTKVC